VNQPRSWRRWLAAAAAVAVSAFSILAAARFQRDPPPAPTPAPGMTVGPNDVALTPDAPQWRLLRLGAARPAQAHWTDALPARIQIDEAKISRIGAPLAGRVTRVLVERGQPVTAGTPLLSIASPNVAELTAEREKAQVDLRVAQANRERVQQVVDAKAAPAKDLVLADQELHQAEVALRLAEAKMGVLKMTRLSGNELTVAAPRDGVVVEKNVVVAQNVAPDAAEPMIVVADLSTVWAVADLFEADATEIAEGASARVTSPSLPKSELTGTVALVSQVVDPQRHTVPIRVRLDNPNKALRPNVYAQVRFLTAALPGAVEVAASAVMTDGSQSYVYVQDAKDPRRPFVKRAVVVGATRDGQVVVLSGLAPAETVVEEGSVLLDNQIALSN
jgi:membrane fusion protein, heavy metal efflux system